MDQDERPDTIAWSDVPTLDVDTLTLGEMAAAELDSGQSLDRLLTAGRATRRLLALWVHERRSCERPRSWHELASLRVRDVPSSSSRPSPAGRHPRSRD